MNVPLMKCTFLSFLPVSIYHIFINFSGLTSKFDISLLKPLNFQTVKLLHCKTEMIQIRVIPNFFVHPAFTKIYPES